MFILLLAKIKLKMLDKMKVQSSFSKTSFAIAIILLLYGFLAQVIPINIFWEAQSIGWLILYISIISILYNGIKIRKSNNKNTILNKIGIGFITFILLIKTILIIIIPNTTAYEVSKEFLINNEDIVKELGVINGFGMIPSGTVQIRKDSNGETGSAEIEFILKGEKKYKEITIIAFKDYNKKWDVYKIIF